MNLIAKCVVSLGLFLAVYCLAQTSEPNSIHENDNINEVIPKQSVSALEEELAGLIALYSEGSQQAQISAINSRIRFSGITDIRLFDIAEKNMMSTYLATGRDNTQYAAWMAQMLAFSGQDKYVASLSKVADTTKSNTVKRHAKKSLEILPTYRRWNTEIGQNLESVPLDQLKKKRLINILNSEDPELVRGGASIANHYFSLDEEITDLAEQRLLVFYKQSDGASNAEYAEASAWLCKVLGSSGNRKYLNTLNEVLANSTSRSVTRWAKKSLDLF